MDEESPSPFSKVGTRLKETFSKKSKRLPEQAGQPLTERESQVLQELRHLYTKSVADKSDQAALKDIVQYDRDSLREMQGMATHMMLKNVHASLFFSYAPTEETSQPIYDLFNPNQSIEPSDQSNPGQFDFLPFGNSQARPGTERQAAFLFYTDFATYIDQLAKSSTHPPYVFAWTNQSFARFAVNRIGFHYAGVMNANHQTESIDSAKQIINNTSNNPDQSPPYIKIYLDQETLESTELRQKLTEMRQAVHHKLAPPKFLGQRESVDKVEQSIRAAALLTIFRHPVASERFK